MGAEEQKEYFRLGYNIQAALEQEKEAFEKKLRAVQEMREAFCSCHELYAQSKNIESLEIRRKFIPLFAGIVRDVNMVEKEGQPGLDELVRMLGEGIGVLGRVLTRVSSELRVNSELEENKSLSYGDLKFGDLKLEDSKFENSNYGQLITALRNMWLDTRSMVEAMNAQGRKIMDRYKRLLEKMPRIAPPASGTDTQKNEEIYQKGRECCLKLALETRRQVKEWAAKKETPNPVLQSYVQDTLNRLDILELSEETVRRIMANDSGIPLLRLWELALNDIRNELADRFLEMGEAEDVLEEETRRFKDSLAAGLYQALRGLEGDSQEGETAQDLAAQGSEAQDLDKEQDMLEWIKSLMERAIGGKPEYGQVFKAIQFLEDFEFNVRTALSQELRRQLSIIHPACREYVPPAIQAMGEPSQVVFYLLSRLSIVEENLRYFLPGQYHVPNQAYFAAAEEFCDRLRFAGTLKEGVPGSVEHMWGNVFVECGNTLQSEGDAQYGQEAALAAQYGRLLEKLEGCVGEVSF